jgi:hypothetical protein
MFLHSVGSAGHVVHSSASRVRNIDAPFFMLGFDRYRHDKKPDGARYAKLVFLYPMGFAGHIVHSSGSEVQNVDAPYLMLGWD